MSECAAVYEYTCVYVCVSVYGLEETKCNYVMLRVAVKLIISNERQSFRNGELSLAFAEFLILGNRDKLIGTYVKS